MTSTPLTMMIVHSKAYNMRIIDTIESASEICCNVVSGCGVLSELNVDIIDKGDSATIKYKGVIDINNAFIKFYGSVSSGANMFTSIARKLSDVTSELEVLCNNGEIVETKRNDVASIIYFEGELISSDSIRLTYFNSVDTHIYDMAITSDVVGVVDMVNRIENNLRLFVINNNYHRMIEIDGADNTKLNNIHNGDVVRCHFDTFGYQDVYPPIQCTYCYPLDDIKIEQSVIEQAEKEYDIYIKSLLK